MHRSLFQSASLSFVLATFIACGGTDSAPTGSDGSGGSAADAGVGGTSSGGTSSGGSSSGGTSSGGTSSGGTSSGGTSSGGTSSGGTSSGGTSSGGSGAGGSGTMDGGTDEAGSGDGGADPDGGSPDPTQDGSASETGGGDIDGGPADASTDGGDPEVDGGDVDGGVDSGTDAALGTVQLHLRSEIQEGQSIVGHDMLLWDDHPAFRPDGSRFDAHPLGPGIGVYTRLTSTDAFDFVTGDELAPGTQPTFAAIETDPPEAFRDLGVTGQLGFSLVGGTLDMESPTDWILNVATFTESRIYRDITMTVFMETGEDVWQPLVEYVDVVLRMDIVFDPVTYDATTTAKILEHTPSSGAGGDLDLAPIIEFEMAVDAAGYAGTNPGTTLAGEYGHYPIDGVVVVDVSGW